MKCGSLAASVDTLSNRFRLVAVMESLLVFVGVTVGCGENSPLISGPSPPTIPALPIFAPTVSLVSPTTGPPEGATVITVTGTGFQSGATLTLDGAATNAIVVRCPPPKAALADCTAITATTAAHVIGTVGVVVTNPGGQSGRLAAE